MTFADQERDIWIWEFARQFLRRFTIDPGGDRFPLWTIDGKNLVWASDREGGGVTNLWWQAADGTGRPTRLTWSPNDQDPQSVSPDGTQVVFTETGADADVMMVSLEGQHLVQPLVHASFVEASGQISPNGRWLAYEAVTDSGQFEIYVLPFPDVKSGGPWQASTAGGTQPLWSRDGKELFYRSPPGAVMSVPVELGATWVAGAPAKVLESRYYWGGTVSARTYDVSRDGRRFLMLKDAGGSGQTAAPASLIVVENWTEELKRRAPTK